MDTNHNTIDNKTRSEVSALFQGYVVQPLTEELQTKLEKAASDENGQFEAVKAELGTVKGAVTRTDSSVRKTAKEETLNASKGEIIGELGTLKDNITRSVTAARNIITTQMKTDNEAANQANQTMLQEMEKTQQEIETELSDLKNRKREQMNLYNKKKSIRDKSLDEQIAPKMQLEALKKQKAAIEAIRQEDSKRLARYLKVAQRHYLQQRDEIVAQMEQCVSGEEKMKLFLLLALTEQDFENLRRTSDGHKS